MALTLMYITNHPGVARIAEQSGVDWIFIDLEIMGKEKRQGHLDTVMSKHTLADIPPVRKALSRARLLVRLNPVHSASGAEIDAALEAGAEILMLPFFRTGAEVALFLSLVAGRAQTCLLCETVAAVRDIDDIIALPGIDCVHIGLNDLHLERGMKFMFELLADGTVEGLCRKFRARGIPYGFGGIAAPGQGALPAEHIIAEHYRLGSTMVILSRSFCRPSADPDLDELSSRFRQGVAAIRSCEADLPDRPPSFFAENQSLVRRKVAAARRELLARGSRGWP